MLTTLLIGLASAATLDCTVEADANPTLGEGIWVSVVLENTGEDDVHLLTRGTAFEEFLTEAFEVEGPSGEALDYWGPDIKYGDPDESEYISIAPGEFAEVSVDIEQHYGFAEGGEHVLSAASVFADVQVGAFESRLADALEAVELSCDSVGFDLSAEGAVYTPSDVQAKSKKKACSSAQLRDIQNAVSAAQIMSQATTDYLGRVMSATSHAEYEEWFGDYSSSSRRTTVTDNYDEIEDFLFKRSGYTFDCGCTGAGTFAYVYPADTKTHTIYLCGAFWNAPVSGRDSRGGTIVHEASHFSDVASTGDNAVGAWAARRQAINNPDKAAANADNYEYLAEDLLDDRVLNPIQQASAACSGCAVGASAQSAGLFSALMLGFIGWTRRRRG